MEVGPRNTIDQRLATATVDAQLSVMTHFIYTVIKVSDDGKFVDLVHNSLEWEECIDGDSLQVSPYGRVIKCSPKKPDVLFDVPVKQYREGDFHIRKRPKVGDVGYIEVFYQDIGTWKENGGFQAPQSINIMAKNSCVFVNGLIAHNEDEDILPPQNILQIKGRTTLFEMQDAVKSESEEEASVPSKITAKITDDCKVELVAPVDSELDTAKQAVVTIGNVTLSIVVPKEGDPIVELEASNANVSVNSKTATVTTTNGISMVGDTSITGNLNISGTTTSVGDVIGAGISLSTHTHMYEDTQPNGTPATKSTQPPV